MKDYIIIILALGSICGLLGYLNSSDISDCEAKGNSYEACNRAFNR